MAATTQDRALVDGPVSFAPAADISAGTMTGPTAMDAADLTGDGLVDIGAFKSGDLAWFEATASSAKWKRHELTAPPTWRPFLGAAKLGDVDGDGDVDVVMAMDKHSTDPPSAYIYWWENPGRSGAATAAWVVRTIVGNLAVHHINDMELADMDGDGKLDVVARSLEPNRLHLFFQNSKTSWQARSVDASRFGAQGEGFAVGNVDGAGAPDITVCGYWLKAPSQPRSGEYVPYVIDAQYSTINANSKEAVGDIDGDGRLDVILSPAEGYRGGQSHVLAWYKAPNNPTSTSSWQRTILQSNLNGGHTVRLGDLDADGDLDVVSGVAWSLWGQQMAIRAFYNEGQGKFGPAQVVVNGKGLYTGVLTDVGNDGDLDIVGQNTYGDTSVPYLYESLEGAQPPAPSCNDGVVNQGETGVDCGGPCSPCDTSGDALPVTGGLSFWLKADTGVVTSGGTVVRWEDQSALQNDLVPASGYPRLVSGALNGHAVVTFDGVADGLGKSNPSGLPVGARDRSVFMVVRYDSDGWGGFTWGTASCNEVFGAGVSRGDGRLMVQGWCGENDYRANEIGAKSGWLRQRIIYGGGTVSHALDGREIDRQNHAFDTGTEAIRLGIEHNDRYKIAMSVAEILVYSRALYVREIAEVENYLQQRYFTVD